MKVEPDKPFSSEGDGLPEAIASKLMSDLHDLRRSITSCCRCTGGGKGFPGCGEPGCDIFLLAGRPGPGASPRNPWGSWRDYLYRRASEECGWNTEGVYLSTALRCPLPKVTAVELRRCAGYLAEELYITGPRLVVVSGKLSAVALRAALGDKLPAKPKAGDMIKISSTRFLFELDIARVEKDEEAAAIFWNILHSLTEL